MDQLAGSERGWRNGMDQLAGHERGMEEWNGSTGRTWEGVEEWNGSTATGRTWEGRGGGGWTRSIIAESAISIAIDFEWDFFKLLLLWL